MVGRGLPRASCLVPLPPDQELSWRPVFVVDTSFFKVLIAKILRL